MKELREIPGYPNFKVSKDGEIWNYKFKKPRRSPTYVQRADYEITNVSNDKGKMTFLVHQLVMSAWGPKRPFPPKDYRISHIDRDKTNNHIDNLKWIHKTDVNTHRATPVVAVGIDDGDKTFFRTLTDASKKFRTHNARLRDIIRAGTVYKGYNFYDMDEWMKKRKGTV